MAMHYPYNPGVSNPTPRPQNVNTNAGLGPVKQVQNFVPPQPAQVDTNEHLVQPIEFTGEEPPVNISGIPIVTPEPPHFSVPSNPLLPDEYKEVLSYESLQYMNGFLRTQIGKECLITMSIGSGGSVLSRFGYLIGVGVNYLLLQDGCSEEILVCDFYSIRLVQLLGKRCPINLNI